ncbi:unnamed protein product (macronuclear) [Paramecium tetraurelia]|uniref:Carboxypeptidase n=3 Tax=Paramecium TaxID=5884 RepID=A0BEU5_PARTE|nr:uncharacterized protein GSPATT00028095001 [Paramecium tetraurelia]CAK57062.1 unnamed protein product [Paramecium tetraurelia]|eukprot:XP_001424460.1 hypothetical protein (macronuclear) [Paramecium tetraurelia strain d4-2]
MKIILVLIITSLVFVRCTDQTSFFAELMGEDLPYYTETDYVKFKDVGSIYYHLILKEGTANLEAIQKGDVLAVWLNGGPGSSSQLGNYMEIGPWVITKNPDTAAKDKPYIVKKREYSWNKVMHLLFIDQPFGAGMSKADKENVVTNSDQAANYFVETLKSIYTRLNGLDLVNTYIFGESYAGHYIPAFATRLLQDKETLDKVNFKGIAIIDGITDTENQLNYYHSYLYSIGAISQLDLNRLQKIGAVGQSYIRNGEYAKGAEQLDLMTDDKFIEQIGNINVYNIRKYKGSDEYDYSWADFLNNYIKQFSSEITKFQRSNEKIYNAFQKDIGESRLKDIQLLLERQYKVLLLNGQLDYIINTPGAWNWIYQIDWKYKYQWKNAKKQFITSPIQGEENKVETHGYIKTFENFSYATIYKAGHMIPTDNPKAAYQVIENFIK